MATEWQKGLKRVVVAVAVPWVLWWAYQARQTYAAIERYQGLRAQTQNAGFDLPRALQILAAMHAQLRHEIVLLVAPFAIGALAYWVYRGFKPKRT
jgi:hypothetical protein